MVPGNQALQKLSKNHLGYAVVQTYMFSSWVFYTQVRCEASMGLAMNMVMSYEYMNMNTTTVISSAGLQLTRVCSSLVPRPHPFTRRNGLVNQVELLGLAHGFATL